MSCPSVKPKELMAAIAATWPLRRVYVIAVNIIEEASWKIALSPSEVPLHQYIYLAALLFFQQFGASRVPVVKIMGKIPSTPVLCTAKFLFSIAFGSLLLLLGSHQAKESPAFLFHVFCFVILSLWLLPASKLTGQKTPPTPLLNSDEFLLSIPSGGLLLLLSHQPYEESPALLFLMFCFFLISLWGLITRKIMGKMIPTTQQLPFAMSVLAVEFCGLLLQLGQHQTEESPALLFLMFCFFLLSSAAVMLLAANYRA